MTTPITHSSHSSIGHALQAKLAQHKAPRRKPRAKPKTYRRSQPAGQRQDPRVSQLERGLKRTVNGRRVLRLGDQLPEARAGVLLAEEGLRSAEANLRRLHQRLEQSERTLVQPTPISTLRPSTGIAEAIRRSHDLRVRLLDAESAVRRWRAELATWTDKRDRLVADIALTARWV